MPLLLTVLLQVMTPIERAAFVSEMWESCIDDAAIRAARSSATPSDGATLAIFQCRHMGDQMERELVPSLREGGVMSHERAVAEAHAIRVRRDGELRHRAIARVVEARR